MRDKKAANNERVVLFVETFAVPAPTISAQI